MIVVYIGKERSKNIEIISRSVEETKDSRICIVCREFNAITGDEGGEWNTKGERKKRKMRDKTKSQEKRVDRMDRRK